MDPHTRPGGGIDCCDCSDQDWTSAGSIGETRRVRDRRAASRTPGSTRASGKTAGSAVEASGNARASGRRAGDWRPTSFSIGHLQCRKRSARGRGRTTQYSGSHESLASGPGASTDCGGTCRALVLVTCDDASGIGSGYANSPSIASRISSAANATRDQGSASRQSRRCA